MTTWPDLAGRLDDGVHVLPVRVYYEDTDFSGVVYHANYLRWFERARSDVLRMLEIDQRAAIEAGEGAYAVADGTNANGQRNVQGRVTSTYHSPTLGKGIAMGLVHRGPDRMGEVLEFPTLDGGILKARIVDPVIYDKDGEKQNV